MISPFLGLEVKNPSHCKVIHRINSIGRADDVFHERHRLIGRQGRIGPKADQDQCRACHHETVPHPSAPVRRRDALVP